MRIRSVWLLSVLALFFLSCFGGIDKRGSVTGYYNGIVRTRGGSFKIGSLPPYWKRHRIRYRALLFQNRFDRSTVTIDAWCQSAFDDGPLAELSRELYRGIADYRVTSTESGMLAGRAVLRTDGTGTLDGRRIYMTTYVLKMNECVFDFIYVSESGQRPYLRDFENMVKGFEYIQGPDIL